MKEITADMYTALKNPLPKEAISQHPTKKFLSTIKAIYVTERLNEVFGVGKWSVKTALEKLDTKSVYNERTKTSSDVTMVVCKTIFEIPDYGVYYECFGGNDNADLGDAFKGATTDAITKIGSYLGIGIDVFKGLKDAPAPTSTTAPVKPTTTPTTAQTTNNSLTEDGREYMLACMVLECKSVDDAKKYLALNKIDIKKYPDIQAALNKKFNLK